jgi:hypothetical protein
LQRNRGRTRRRLIKWARDVTIVTYSVDPHRGLCAAALKVKAPTSDVTRHAFFRCYAKAVGFYGVVFPDVEKASQYIEEVKKTGPSASANPTCAASAEVRRGEPY